MKKVQWISLFTLILGIFMIIPGWMWMNTSGVGSLAVTSEETFDVSPTQLSQRSQSIGNWPLPPNEVTIIASIFAFGENATYIPPDVEAYHEHIEIDIEIQDTAGYTSTPATAHLGMELTNQSEFGVQDFYTGTADNFVEIQLPSITRFWLNVTLSTRGPGGEVEAHSQITVVIKFMTITEPLEHDIALGLFFTGIAFMAESFVIFIAEFARD